MSLQRIILISGTAQINGYIEKDGTISPNKPTTFQNSGVNVVLGGTMMAGIVITVFLICYCCHRRQQYGQTNVPQYWRDPGLSVEVYTVEGQQTYEVPDDLSGHVHQGPPPSYESVVVVDYEDIDKVDLRNVIKNHPDYDGGLPTYDDAIKMARRENST
ncbi:uncharacterized protein LOC116179048 [Photinus pyralis]|uniref:uncharacterized protein LOC116179048 n=1 Tax=Photinus pyralis TaxID=7054 RepID=UPI0012674BA0|nr:uncharacterized protein LOC116179048 [Photinus pyralis]